MASSCALVFVLAERRVASARDRLDSAAVRLAALTAVVPADDSSRSAIAWGYAERLRLGLEAPFFLMEGASRDPRLLPEERRTVAWALLAHVLRGESHAVDPAAFDGLGDMPGEWHMELIESTVAAADNPRAGELAVRLAYTLAVTERLLDSRASLLASEGAAMIADREIARREAGHVVRAAASDDPISLIARRRARRSFYVERPALFAPAHDIEREAIAMSGDVLEALRERSSGAFPVARADSAPGAAESSEVLAKSLVAAGNTMPPSAAIVATVRRFAPLIQGEGWANLSRSLQKIHNAEMLAAFAQFAPDERGERRTFARMMLSAAVAMRTNAQQRVWFPGDSAPTAPALAAAMGLRSIGFDNGVPTAWRGWFLATLESSLRDIRAVFPSMDLDEMDIRFGMAAPVDSALAMHDPRTRTIHLPILTAGGTLTHELAHDLDRVSALAAGLPGYRSDIAARGGETPRGRNDARVSAPLRTLAENVADGSKGSRAPERPAEIFATHVDWFVAGALARRGVSSGFLSAVQDELLTGHVVHPDRMRSTGRSRSLLSALEAMTEVAPSARTPGNPTSQTLLRWVLDQPIERRPAMEVLRGQTAFETSLAAVGECDVERGSAEHLVRMAVSSRVRGWMRNRARWSADSARAPWARSVLGESPWRVDLAEQTREALESQLLAQLTVRDALPAGLSAYGTGLAQLARCSE